jgi:mono/diheme cytochrome c family protein
MGARLGDAIVKTSRGQELPSIFIYIAGLLALLVGCNAERRKSDAELGLTAQQIAGRKIYDQYCDRCHEPYSSSSKQGPPLKGIFNKSYMPMSGLPANDERMSEIIRTGRAKMPAFGQALSSQQIEDLISYMHTL